MPIVKLDAIGSTNDFLSEMIASQPVENYTVVTATSQTKGRGQQGANWYSEPGKNLTVSVYIESVFASPDAIFTLNAAVALAVADTLATFDLQDVAIKWPNDILSGSSKVSGILIENTWRSSHVASIVGIGLNVNQTDFAGMPHVSSMAHLKNRQFDRDAVLDILLTNLKAWTLEAENRSEEIWSAYHKLLF
ncbi:MAG TPA: biotin--[acetyl-CoA-carboxylase] ligase, partial [Flavobacterium sp.]|nr:biotin--[acetyl-CoA-carboxylase] ligase [Flavobacterium sp.]